jgi:hypothetical protein
MTMTQPTRSFTIGAALAINGVPPQLGSRAAEHPCEGVKFHSPTPLTTRAYTHHGRTVAWLCPTCTANLECFLHLSHANPDGLPWEMLREFGNQIRAYGQRILADDARRRH